MSQNQDFKLQWDFMIQSDIIIQARSTDIILLDKVQTEVKIIEIAIIGDSRIEGKKQWKIKKYEEVKEEIGKLWNMRKVTVIPVVIGALGCISQRFDSYVENT